MTKVELYTTMFCPYCARARSLLQKKGVSFTDIDVMTDDDKWNEMIERAGGRRTVPQIFIDGKHIGGSDELTALDHEGKLDPLLGVGR
ncbi:MAG: glutaredoxin 3 [Alphaproteobacteria bacterium]|nr:glutaredoxin 3 [Alphaproteobacteria bacterium]